MTCMSFRPAARFCGAGASRPPRQVRFPQGAAFPAPESARILEIEPVEPVSLASYCDIPTGHGPRSHQFQCGEQLRLEHAQNPVGRQLPLNVNGPEKSAADGTAEGIGNTNVGPANVRLPVYATPKLKA